MELFEGIIPSVHAFIAAQARTRSWPADPSLSWPAGGSRNIVLKEDLGLELGSPEMESLSCLLWTADKTKIEDAKITLAGPDFVECTGRGLPFGKVVMLGVKGFDEDNAYDRHKELDFLRYDLDLKGFMMRAASQYMREWCRISRDALAGGFSARTLGSSLMRLFREKDYVTAMEVVFITSGPEEVSRLREITSPAQRIISAMNKMAAEMDFECGGCDYQDVCSEAEGLKGMRDRLKNKSREARHG